MLSTNAIDKIANLNGLKCLRILSLSRNNIKNLNGLDAVGDTLQELWISYNNIEKLKGINVLKRLKVLKMTNNKVKVGCFQIWVWFLQSNQDWGEFTKIGELTELEDLGFTNNPLEVKGREEGDWAERVGKCCQARFLLDFLYL